MVPRDELNEEAWARLERAYANQHHRKQRTLQARLDALLTVLFIVALLAGVAFLIARNI